MNNMDSTWITPLKKGDREEMDCYSQAVSRAIDLMCAFGLWAVSYLSLGVYGVVFTLWSYLTAASALCLTVSTLYG